MPWLHATDFRSVDLPMLQLYRIGQVKQAALTATGKAGCAAGKAMLLERAACTVLLLKLPRSLYPSCGFEMTQDLPKACQEGLRAAPCLHKDHDVSSENGLGCGQGEYCSVNYLPKENSRQKNQLQRFLLNVSPADRSLTP
jgi:hypothetical protein